MAELVKCQLSTVVAFLLFYFARGGSVLQLSHINGDDLYAHPVALVKYYAPWCGHCKRLAPEFEKAAEELARNYPPVTLFETNCDDENNRDLCNKAGVSGYPTLKYYFNGELGGDFEGKRDVEGIVSFMKAMASPLVEEFMSMDELNARLKGDKPIVALQHATGDEEFFISAARKLRMQLRFMFTRTRLLDPSRDILLQVFFPSSLATKLEDSHKTYSGHFNSEEVTNWVVENAVGLAGHRRRDNEVFFKKPLLVVYTRANMDRDASNIRYHRNRMIKVAKSLETNLQFAICDAREFSGELSEIGIESNEGETSIVIITADSGYFVMKTRFGADELQKFVRDYEQNDLEPFVKSEPIPETQDDNVLKVVGKTFDKIVNDPTKDVFIQFFAPWCGHCQKLKPIYEDFAKEVSSDDGLIVAAIDATANHFPSHFKITGFPTIYWAPKNDKKNPIVYDGERTVKGMVEFIGKRRSKKEEL